MSTSIQSGRGTKRKTSEKGGEGSREESSPPRRVLRSATSTPVKPPVVEEAKDLALYTIFERQKRRKMRKEEAKKIAESISPPLNLGRAVKFPPRLLNVSDIPETGKVTTYSKPENLLAIKGVLGASPFFKVLLESPLGSVFDVAVKKAAMSGRLVHNMLCRTLLTRRRHEIWFVIANKPIRFSLNEFAVLTGLPCGPYPPESEVNKIKSIANSKNAYWNELMVGRLASGSISDIVDLLWSNDELKEERKKIPMATRFRLCLVVLIDGILCPIGPANVKATRFTVEMVRDVKKFLAYPWGRQSFELTLEVCRVGSVSNPTVDDLLKRLVRQTHICLKGFPVALQLLFYAAVPAFNRVVFPDPREKETDFLQTKIEKLDVNRSFSNETIFEIDTNPETAVISLVEYGYDIDGVDLSWEDDMDDPLVQNVLRKIAEGYQFKEGNWKKGVIDIPADGGFCQVSKKGKGLARKTSRPTRKSGRGKPKQTQPKLADLDPSKFFLHNPNDITNDFYYTVVTPLWEEKKKRDAKYKEEIDNQFARFKEESEKEFYVDLLKELIDNSKAQKIFKKPDDVSGSSAGSAEGEDSSNSIEDVTGAQDMKGKDKVTETVSEEVYLHSEDEELLKELGEGTSGMRQPALDETLLKEFGEGTPGMRQPTFDETPGPYAAGNLTGGLKLEELVGVHKESGDAFMGDAIKGTDEAEKLGIEKTTPSMSKAKLATNEGSPEATNPQVMDFAETNEQQVEKGIVLGVQAVDSPAKPEGKNVGTITEIRSAKEFDLEKCGFSAVEEWKKKAFFRLLDEHKPGFYYILDWSVPKPTFREIATEQFHVSTNHMELMLELVWARLSEELAEKRAVILDTHFMQHLKDAQAKLKQKRSKQFKWHKSLQAIVNGGYAKRSGRTRWMVDVDKVYAPMNWSDNHWVALCIDFTTGFITVFDSFIDLHTQEKAVELMAPVLETLPQLIADLVPRAVADYEPPTTWAFKRPKSVYQNIRTGDCGPLAVKYIELVCQGFPVEGITDEMVDNLRLNYAVDVYEMFYTVIH